MSDVDFGVDASAQAQKVFRMLRSAIPSKILPSISEWAENKRYLTKKETSRPGKFSFDYTPYTREIADCFADNSDVREVAIMKGVQLGFTDGIFLNTIGYRMDYSPAPMMLVSADKGLLKEFKNVRIASMINNSGLQDKIKADNSTRNSRRQGDTATMVEFPGGFLRLAGSHNPADLRSMSIKILLLDEIDGYPNDIGGEGSPIDLAKKRTDSFGKGKKIGYISTPTTKEETKIEKYYEMGDKRRYFVPCPHCGKRQVLVFFRYNGGKYSDEHQVFDKKNNINHKPYGFVFNSTECKAGDYKSVGYKCKFCAGIIKEYHKREMNIKGQWFPTAKSKVPYFRSYHLSSFYSPAKEWWEVVKDFLESKKDPVKLKTFKNMNEGVPFDDKTASIVKTNVYPRRKNFAPNRLQEGALFVVAACDVQHDRLEVEIKAFGDRYRNWTVDYRVWHGDTGDKSSEPWKKLKALSEERFPGGGWSNPRLIELIVVDSSDGARTHTVYEFCRDSNKDIEFDLFFPLKGQDDTAKTRNELKTTRLNDYGLILVEPYVNLYKNKLSSWLSREWREFEDYPHGWAEFPNVFSDMKNKSIEKYLHQLTAEKKVKEQVGNVIRYKWKSDGRRNEAFDTFVYCIAAADYYIERTCLLEFELVDAHGKPKVDSSVVFEHLQAELLEEKEGKTKS